MKIARVWFSIVSFRALIQSNKLMLHYLVLEKEPLCHTHIKVNLGSIFLFLYVKVWQVLYCLVQLDVVLLYLYLLLVGLWHQNMLSLMVTQAAYQMLYHFDKSKTHICYISLIKGAVYSLFLTRCPPIGFTSIKHKGHMPYCLVYQMVWAPIC